MSLWVGSGQSLSNFDMTYPAQKKEKAWQDLTQAKKFRASRPNKEL